MSNIKKIGDKYYDFGCENKSFLQTASELKEIGIKNYYFMLEVKNPMSGVCDIDPFKPDIKQHEIKALMMELRQNMWFYARTVARVRTDKGVVPFCLHRGLAAAMWCFERHLDACLCEPRQTYKTTGIIAAPISWAFQIASQNTNIKFFGKDSDNTKKNLEDLKNDIEILPKWLQFTRYIDVSDGGKVKKTRRAAETLRNEQFHNKVTTTSKATSKSHAMQIARGESGAIFYHDEIEHTPHFPTVLTNSSPAHKTAKDNAIAAGQPAGRIFTTTPGDLDTPEGRATMPIIRSMIPWTEKLYDMSDIQIRQYIDNHIESYRQNEELQKDGREPVEIFYMEYQYWQVRKDDDWVKEQLAMTGDKMGVRREILLQRLRGSSSSPINPEDIEFLISNMQKSTTEILLNDKWILKLYPHGQGIKQGKPKLLDEKIPYIVGVDPSGGTGGDNTAITILNPYNLQIAGELRSPYISGTELRRLLIELVLNYIPYAVVIPEKNSMGHYLIHELCESSISHNLYWSESARQLEQITEDNGEDSKLKQLSDRYKKYGTYTTTKVRKAMFELLMRHVAECKHILNTEYLVDDICKLVRINDKIAADKGEHDDSLMSYLHCLYIYYTGDNLGYFGIDNSVNPVLGEIDPNLDNIDDYRDNINGLFSTEDVSFERIYIDNAVVIEEYSKFAVNSSLNIYDPIYSNMKDDNDSMDIPPSFFDMINSDSF